MAHQDDANGRFLPTAVRTALILVAITAVASLLYALQYYAGGPLRLKVVSQINAMDLSPQATTLAAGAQDGGVRVWTIPKELTTSAAADFAVAKEQPWALRTLSGHISPVIEVGFSPDGSRLTSVSRDGQVRVWTMATNQVEREFDLSTGPLTDADLSADRSVLATVGEDGMVRVWDLASGQPVQAFGPNPNTRLAVAISRDGLLVAAGDGPNVEVWEARTGRPVGRLEGYWESDVTKENWLGHKKEVTTLAFSPDGTTLASGSVDRTLVFWDVQSGKVASGSEGAWAAIAKIVFDQKGTIVLGGSRDTKARTYRLPGAKSSAIYEGHLAVINGLAFGPVSGMILTASADGTVRMWETANQYTVHLEWSRLGFQPTWGKVLAAWMLVSGLLGLLCVWGLRRFGIWSHLLALALFLLGPIPVLGLPILEVFSYPLRLATKLSIAWPLIGLAVWYLVILVLLTRDPLAVFYEAPRSAALAKRLVASQRTVKTRLGLYGLAVWIGLLVILYSVLRRFNLDIAFMGHFLPFIMAGSWITFRVSALSILLAVVLALLGALGRLSKNPLANGISSFYISLIRGTPLLVQIFIWYLGLPRLGIVLAGELAGILALGVNYGAYMTEIFRAGIQAIGKGQHEAAAALGMSRGQTLMRIVLPQAFRIVIPPIGNEFIAMMKDSSLVSVMSIWELTYRAQKIGRQNFRNMETFLIAAGFYWILTVVFQFLQGKLEDYMARSERR